MLPLSESLRLNQYAQGIRPMVEAKEWFATFSIEHKRNVLRELAAMIQQAHPQPTEVEAAIAKAGIKHSHTPSVLLSRGPFPLQAAKVVTLPDAEQAKAFLLFVALLGIADGRRRHTECVGGCSHWWHQDLSDELRVRKLVDGA